MLERGEPTAFPYTHHVVQLLPDCHRLRVDNQALTPVTRTQCFQIDFLDALALHLGELCFVLLDALQEKLKAFPLR